MLRLTTWNVQNLFRPAAGASAANVALYRQKLVYLAATIGTLDPDVIGLQEVGGANGLADLQAELGGAYAHSHIGTPDGRGIACAILSKTPLSNTTEVLAFPQEVLDLHLTELDGTPMNRMGRGAVRATVTKGNFTTDVIVVHLKSKLLTFPGGAFSTNNETVRAQVASLALMKRTAEAATVRMAANGVVANNVGQAIVVLGDFNDAPHAATTQIFQGPDGSEIDTRGFDLADAGDSARLWNLAPCIDEDRRFSRMHRGQGELLDQIFVSEEYFPRQSDGLRLMPVSVDSLIENVRSIGDNAAAESNHVRPDHAPVTAVFDL